MTNILYLPVENLRQYRLIASPHSEALLHLLCEFATSNNKLERPKIVNGPRLAAARSSWSAAQQNR
jgi:hypothetical protein